VAKKFLYTPWESQDLANHQIPEKTNKPFRVISGLIGMPTGIEVALCASENEAIAAAKKLAKDKVKNAGPMEDWGFFVFHPKHGYIWEVVREWDPIIGVSPKKRKGITGNFNFAARTGKANRQLKKFPLSKETNQFINKRLKDNGVSNAIIKDTEASLIALHCIGKSKPWRPRVKEYLSNMTDASPDVVAQILADDDTVEESSLSPAEEDSTDELSSTEELFQPIPNKVEGGFACPITDKTYKTLGKRLINHMIENLPDNALPVHLWKAYEIEGVWYCPYTGKSYKANGKRLETQLASARAELEPPI
jgi:hypothetical protein